MNIDNITNYSFSDVVQEYSVKDTLFYALSVGFGSDPVDKQQLNYVFEKELSIMPAMVTVMGRPKPWGSDPSLGIDLSRVVYAEQSMEIHKPLPVSGTIRARESVVGIVDKGANKGAFIYTERHIVNNDNNELLATLKATLMCRGNGGCGSTSYNPKPTHILPSLVPEKVIEIETLPQQALLYRLNGDMNPLHADPKLAQKVGFERPILHGLCSYGFTVNALLKLWCDNDGSKIKSVDARFSAPIYPGETFIIETWRTGDIVSFRVLCKERGVKVLDNGMAIINL